MALFNYSRLKYFNTKGQELPLIYDAPKVTFVNPRFNDESGEYLVVVNNPDDDKSISFMPNKTGKRFLSTDTSVKCEYNSKTQSLKTSVTSDCYTLNEYTSTSDKTEHYFRFLSPKINDVLDDLGVKDLKFPSLKFSSKLYFNKVSTGLVETESIYILTESFADEFKTHRGTHKYTTVAEHSLSCNNSASSFIDRYKLMFFIDCREQSNFRFFTTKNNEVVWSDRKFIDFNADNNYAVGDTHSGYRVDIGFTGDLEGTYEDNMYVFIIDTKSKDEYSEYPGDAYLIGTIKLFAETEGEDERYRTLCDNFGLPDPKETYNAFAETDILQESPDYVKINKFSKKLYLSYDQIFPYVGTYKALINILKVLGYNDIFFKEWYKDLGSNKKSNLVTFDIDLKYNKNLKTISNIPLEERIQLKKLNWISMVYKMSEENNIPIDEFGFPSVDTKDNYYDNGTLVKLISLKKYLEKYILGVNCTITDITGEGIIFERYNTYKYGTYQQVLEYNNEKSISLQIDNPNGTICDGYSCVEASIITSNSDIPIEDLKGKTFLDYCDGYISEDGKYHESSEIYFDIDNSTNIYTGKTIELNDNTSSYEIRSLGKIDSFRFNKESFLTEKSPSLIVDDGEIIFDPKDLLTHYKNSAFNPDCLPTIQIKKGYIRSEANESGTHTTTYKISPDDTISDNVSYTITKIVDDREQMCYTLKDTPTFLAPKFISNDKKYWKTSSPEKYYLKYNKKSKNKKTSNAVDSYYPFSTVKLSTAITGTNITYNIGTYSQSSIEEIKTRYDDFSYVPNETYGLRYSTDNIHNIPSFLIKGYICSEIMFNYNLEHFPDIYHEWHLDIIEGSMIFNDSNKNSKVSLNFSLDENGEIVVNVTTLQQTHIDGTHKYICKYPNIDPSSNTQDDSLIEDVTFNKMYNYTPFISEYRKFNYNGAIKYNPTINIPFYNAGSYNLNVIMTDQCNNIFSTKIDKKVTIQTPHVDTMFLTDEDLNEYSICTKNTEVFRESDTDMCVYKYEPKRPISSQDARFWHTYYDGNIDSVFYHLKGCYDDNATTGIKPHSTLQFGNFVQISNTLDKFVLIGTQSDKVTKLDELVLTKRSSSDGHMIINGKNHILVIYNTSTEYVDAIIHGILITTSHYRFRSNCFYNDKETFNRIVELCKKPYNELYIIPSWVNDASIYIDNNGFNKITGYPGEIPNNSLHTIYYKHENGQSGSTLVLSKESSKDLILKKNIISYEPDNTRYHFYIAPPDTTYTSYIMPIDKNKSSKDFIYSNDRKALNISQHIDCGFTASIRDFDITISQQWYKNGLEKYNNIENLFTHKDKITSKGFVMLVSGLYDTTNDETSTLNTNISYLLNKSNNTQTSNDTKTYRWKVYKQSTHRTSHKLILDCFNDCPVFYINEKGIYDVESIVYDKNGNKHSNFSTGSITII